MPNSASIPTLSADDLLRTFTRKDVRERLGISTRSLDRLLDRGALKAVAGTRGKGRATLITAASLYDYIYGGGR